MIELGQERLYTNLDGLTGCCEKKAKEEGVEFQRCTLKDMWLAAVTDRVKEGEAMMNAIGHSSNRMVREVCEVQEKGGQGNRVKESDPPAEADGSHSLLPHYSFDRTTVDPRVSSTASSGLKNTAKAINTVTKAPMRRCNAAELVIFGLGMPTSNNVRKSLDAVGTSALRLWGIRL